MMENKASKFVFYVTLAILLAAFLLPSVMTEKPDLPPQEASCAWRAAERFVYDTPFERVLILGYEIERIGEGYTYLISPVSFFALPWRLGVTRCVPQNGFLEPYDGWIVTEAIPGLER